MKYTSNDIQIILIHPVISAGQGGVKVVDHPVYCIVCKQMLRYDVYDVVKPVVLRVHFTYFSFLIFQVI